MVFKRGHNVPPWPQELKKSLAWIGLIREYSRECREEEFRAVVGWSIAGKKWTVGVWQIYF